MTDQVPKRWRLTRSACWRILLAISIVLVTYVFGKAQPPLPQAPTTTDTVVIAEPSSRSPATEAVLNSLTASNPQSPAELFSAVLVLRQFGEYEEAKKYLARLSQLDASQLVALHAEIGSGALVKLSRDAGMAPEGFSFTSSVFQAVKESRRDPARLEAYIAGLASESAEQLRQSISAIAAAGADAVPVLLAAHGSPPSGVTTIALRQAMVAIGARAEEPLVAALGGPDPVMQSEAAFALGYVGSRQSAVHLLRPFHVGAPDVQRAAADALDRLNTSAPESIASTSAFLKRHALRYLRGESPGTADPEGNVELWTWDAQQENVVRSKLDRQDGAIVLASRIARDLYELNPTAENARLLLVSRLEVDQRIVGLDEQLPRGDGSAFQLGSELGVSMIDDALAYSLTEGFDAAAIGACQLLGNLGSEDLLRGQQWCPLVRGLKSANRRVRYASARAVVEIDPRRSFPGASYLFEGLLDLANATGVPRAVLGSPRDDTSFQLSGLLASFGYDVQRGTRGNSFLTLAFGSSDHDLFIVSDAIEGPPASETIQQLRMHPRSKSLPIILLVREGNTEAADRLAARDDLVLTMPEFADETTLSQTLQLAATLVGEAVVAPERRLEQAADALQWLTHLAQYSQTYHWYDFSRAKDVADAAVYVDGLSHHAIDLLGYLGLESAQQVLVDTASQTGSPADRRQQAANAFTEAVLRRGLLLRGAAVTQQYARYNASKTADTQTQEILAQVLDTIESRTQSE